MRRRDFWAVIGMGKDAKPLVRVLIEKLALAGRRRNQRVDLCRIGENARQQLGNRLAPLRTRRVVQQGAAAGCQIRQ